MAWTLRVRGPAGQSTLRDIQPTGTVTDFQDKLATACGVSSEVQEIRCGFPPKQLALPADPAATSVQSWGLQNGDSLIVSKSAQQSRPLPQTVLQPAQAIQQPAQAVQQAAQAEVGRAALAPAAAADDYARRQQMEDDEMMARALAASLEDYSPAAVAAPVPAAPSRAVSNAASPSLVQHALPDGRCMTRRVVDSDNSCLFNAVGYNVLHSRSNAAAMRQVVAKAVAADPYTFNEGFLGKANEEYQRWIKDSQKWGGAIELFILSTYYKCEIAAYDVRTKRCDLYGQNPGVTKRCFLVYDGLHYDAMALAASANASERNDITLADIDSPDLAKMVDGAEGLVGKLHDTRKFTDTANFTLRCGVCGQGLKGEKEALEHAKASGHQNFQEY